MTGSPPWPPPQPHQPRSRPPAGGYGPSAYRQPPQGDYGPPLYQHRPAPGGYAPQGLPPQQSPYGHCGPPLPVPPLAPQPRQRRKWPLIAAVAALLVAIPGGAEWLVRYSATSQILRNVECVTGDTADATFGAKSMLWQYITGTIDKIEIHTAGHRVRAAQELSIDATLTGVSTADPPTAQEIEATLTWPTAGITATIAEHLGALGSRISVSTDSSAGQFTVKIDTPLGDVPIKATPKITNGKVGVEITNIPSSLPIPGLSASAIQTALDTVAERLTGEYPLGLKADSVEVLADGARAHLRSSGSITIASTGSACYQNS
ncbi:DUF2993 domain-containing protein [Mycobacteroides abscessus]|uniref:LmeA family phospholipid-binding protein n=1 Tax=Mycobacteroides abscessus TaxID=36809 RepID=UPI000C265C82|nr:DUF2993 domain-containing protein [Mycobacteroides abscessus]